MTKDFTRPRRHSIRLPGHDYCAPGAYFVNICAHRRACLFGDIANGEMHTNRLGALVRSCWNDIPDHFPNVLPDAFAVMPNHVHGIVFLGGVAAQHASPLHQNIKAGSLPAIVRSFKAVSTKRIREFLGDDRVRVWQPNYYEHLVRNELDLEQMREYIINNPAMWAEDDENPGEG